MKRFLMLFCFVPAATVFGQSFNVDMNAASGAGAGVPSNAFKGAAGQAGVWNGVGTASSVTLSDISGNLTGVTLTRSGAGTIGSNSTAALTGDDEKLLEDAFEGNNSVTLTFSFNNLQAGKYALYTYAIDPASFTTMIVNTAGSTSQSNQQVGSMMSGPNYFVGATHALHVLNVNQNGSVTATIAPTGFTASVAGFQLVKLSGSLLRLHVDDSAAGARNGATWADAFTNPVTALSTARIAGGQNCEVWVANGIYKPTTGSDRYASFDVPSHLKFYGGFNGDETSLSERTGLNLCYLNGEIGNSGTDTDNCYVVVNADMTAADTLIDGFRIHNGYNDEGSTGGGKGGGLRLLSGSATVRNCTFVDNWASNYGGGVYAYNGTPVFVNCLFYQNEAFRGAGIYFDSASPVRLYNCDFLDNYTFDGAAYFNGGLGTLAGCFFHGNYASGNGGAIHASGAILTVAGCTIAGNSAGTVVGGVYARNNSSVGIQNSILWANNDQFNATTLEKQYDNESNSTITVAATTAQGAAGSNGQNPLFVDGDGADNVWGTFDDNCYLQANSPCLDTGNNAYITTDLGDLDQDGNTGEQIPLDFNGSPRIRYAAVDRGAFERQPPLVRGDMNCDGVVDFFDIDPFMLAVLDPATYQSNYPNCNVMNGDANGDYTIDFFDIDPFMDCILNGGCP